MPTLNKYPVRRLSYRYHNLADLPFLVLEQAY